jgi:hypothetical protein
LRRALPGIADSYDHVRTLLPDLVAQPRLVVTQTIAPATAVNAAANFEHLVALGFRRFNFLPGYFIAWSEEQLALLARGFEDIGDVIRSAWARGERLYVRNLFTYANTPFFNTGLVVDADRTIHPSNVGLSGALEELLDQTRVGTLDDPPAPEMLEERSRAVNDLIARTVPPRVWESTLAVDAMLTGFVRTLAPAYAEHRRRRRAA